MPSGGARPGSGRKKGSGNSNAVITHAVRIPIEVTKEDCQAIPSLKAILRYWEDELEAARQRGESLRTYEKLEQLLNEVKLLGF